ncbi:hypothetical protein GZ212_01755 [Mangrovimonas sp. CR14]|uniref:O-antigen ligase family protein n=1 Tax=Mangrovimonas sp. CR14 TaxID=2706120 RepID=UPI001421DD18|nr:hypothetical protein [Mangrovimonas sp. CR14]
MFVLPKLKTLFSTNKAHYFVALILSTLMLGYAPSSIALALLVVYCAIFFFTNKKFYSFKDLALLLPIILYVWFLTTYLWTLNEGLTLKGLGRMLALFLVPCSFLIIPKFTLDQFKFILNTYTCSNLLFGVLFIISAFIRYMKSRSFTEFTYHDLTLDFELNAIYVSAFFSISFFYLLLKSQKRPYELFALIFLLFLLILLSSKSILFCTILGTLLFGFRQFYFKRIKFLKLVFGGILILLIISFSSKEILKRVEEELVINSREKISLQQVLEKDHFSKVYPWTGTSIRLFQLRLLKEQIQEKRIFLKGFGLFASRDDLKKRHLKYGTYKGYHLYNYHNNYAQTFAESGIFGLFLILLIIALNVLMAIRSKYFLFIFFSILIPIWFFTESVLWVQRGLFFFIIFYCLFNRSIFTVRK